MKRWKHKSMPSEHYLGAIRRAFDRAKREGTKPTPNNLWNYVSRECLMSFGGFRKMFAWDRRLRVNRTKDITEVIEAGLVPGLQVEHEGRKAIVTEE